MKSKSFDVAGKLESDLESTDAAVEVVCALQLPWKVLPISTTLWCRITVLHAY